VGFTAIFIMIFLIAFALIGGLVMFLSRTIEHGEARFDASGKMISDSASDPAEPARPATRNDETDTTGDMQ
jgi:hypothetical protein